MVIYKSLLADPEDGDGEDAVVHNSEGRSKANPPALTLPRRSGYNYFIDRVVERGWMQDGMGAAAEWQRNNTRVVKWSQERG